MRLKLQKHRKPNTDFRHKNAIHLLSSGMFKMASNQLQPLLVKTNSTGVVQFDIIVVLA